MEQPRPQLQMVWPEQRLTEPPDVILEPGYSLRCFEPDRDLADYLSLVHEAGFTDFDEQRVHDCIQKMLPNGFYVVVHEPDSELVATAQTTHNPTPLHPYGGELGWVAGRTAHAGHGLGMAVCAAVVRRHLSAGYERIYLNTDDFRLPALKTYLKLGFVPFIFGEGMPGRWEAICQKLDWPYTPDAWPGTLGR